MQKSLSISLSIITSALILAAGIVVAQESTVSFPVAELGNCSSKEECRAYCDDATHIDACVSFGESHGLMSKGDANIARTLGGKPGPGGCRGEACREYCAAKEHAEECLVFAEKNGFIKPGEVKAALEYLARGGPGQCKSESECRAY